MATQFDEIYARFQSRVRNYDYLDFEDSMAEQHMHDLLMLSIGDFIDICHQDLEDYDEELMQFNIDLTRREKDILALGMVKHFTEPFIYNTDALQNALNTKDFSLYSPANLLREMTVLLHATNRKLRGEINMYSFRGAEISKLTETE